MTAFVLVFFSKFLTSGSGIYMDVTRAFFRGLFSPHGRAEIFPGIGSRYSDEIWKAAMVPCLLLQGGLGKSCFQPSNEVFFFIDDFSAYSVSDWAFVSAVQICQITGGDTGAKIARYILSCQDSRHFWQDRGERIL